jgi:hypothetical protein
MFQMGLLNYLIPFLFGLYAFLGVTIHMTNKHPGKMNSPTQVDLIIGSMAGISTCAAIYLLIKAIY